MDLKDVQTSLRAKGILPISVNQLRMFKSCGRQWKVLKSGDHDIGEESDAMHFRIGTAVHEFLDKFHTGAGLEASIAAFKAKLLRPPSDDPDVFIDNLPDSEVERTLALVTAYAAFELARLDGFGGLAEAEVQFPLDDSDEEIERYTVGFVKARERAELVRVVLCGRIDGIAANGTVLEHKTAKTLDALNAADAALDEQASAMLWAQSKRTNAWADSLVFNVLQKSAHKFQPRENGETAKAFGARILAVMQASPASYFARVQTFRRREQLLDWQASALDVAWLMVDGPWIPAFKGSWEGPCRRCKLRDACISWHDLDRRNMILRGLS